MQAFLKGGSLKAPEKSASSAGPSGSKKAKREAHVPWVEK